MYLKKHTVLQKLFSEKYHWGGGTSSQDAKSSIWYKHKLTAWWRHNLLQLWEAYSWDGVTPHILQCCRDIFFFQENVIWNIFTTELNRDCEIEQALLICLSFLVNILLVFFFVLFCLFLSRFASTFFSPCNFNALDEECIISHTSWKKKKKKTSFCIKRYICHISPCSSFQNHSVKNTVIQDRL